MNKLPKPNRIQLSMLLIAFAAVGTVGILISRAATPTASIEPESSETMTTTLINDATASNGGAVKFGAIATAALSQIPATPRPTIETQIFNSSGDIADDSVIYADASNPANSVVIADNKHGTTGGVGVFNMQGAMIQFRQDGKIGNIDMRPGFPFGGRNIILVGANNRTNDTLIFWEYNPTTRQLSAPISASIPTIPANYGFCMYKHPTTGKYYAFVSQETGTAPMQQFELFESGGKVAGTLVRTFNVGSTAEGCAVDDANNRLYVAQESTGLWRYGAEPTAGSTRTQIDAVGGGHLVADVEGVSIAYGPNGTGYIVVSSQGSSQYAVYDRQTNAYMRNFTVGSNGTIDAVNDTDGLDISTANLGPGFTKGMLVVHDGVNTGASTSNLKYVPLE